MNMAILEPRVGLALVSKENMNKWRNEKMVGV